MPQPTQSIRRFLALIAALLLAACLGCDPPADDGSGSSNDTTGESNTTSDSGPGEIKTVAEGKQPHVAYVTNGIASFWDIAEKGAMDGGKEFDAKVDVRMPAKGVEDQKLMVQGLLGRGIDGIAISTIDAENQTDLLDEIAENTNFITQDADAPNSKRLMYIGMNNYTAGRMCGELVKKAIPDGGEIVIFVGRLGQSNAELRRQGTIDAILDRDSDPTRRDPPDKPVSNDKYTILDTRTDDFDFPKAKQQAEDAIARYADLDCMVGLFAYNPPLILEAVKAADKLDQIKIVSFDEDEVSLQAIAEGEMVGTVVQNPYRYGHESVRVLAALARGDKSVIPESGFLDIPARTIDKSNVIEFWTELNGMLGKPAPEVTAAP